MIVPVDIHRSCYAIKPDNIVVHKVPVEDMSLEIRITMGYISLELVLLGSNRTNYIIEGWEPKVENGLELADKRYDEVLDKLERGEYSLHIYDDGTIELKVDDDE